MERHSGRILAELPAEGGTRIVIRLPDLLAAEAAQSHGSAARRTASASWLAARGVAVENTLEPTTGPIGAVIRQALERRIQLDQAALALAFAADRVDHLHNRQNGILARVDAGRWVLSDRYLLSSLAYQQAETVDLDWLVAINRFAPPPDLTIFVDTDLERCLLRIGGRSAGRDLFENEASLRRVAAGYRRALGMPAIVGEVLTVDGNGTPEQVFAAVLDGFGQWCARRGIELAAPAE